MTKPPHPPVRHPLAEISIWLDTYDDVFSDFDPRPYAERTLSDDFLQAVQKEVRANPAGRFEVKLLIPAKLRQPETERIIAGRIAAYFREAWTSFEAETRRTQRFGVLLTVLSVVTIFLATLVQVSALPAYLKSLLAALLEPAGWFMVFTGLERLLLTPEQKKEQAVFLRKMSDGIIEFVPY